MALLSWIKGFIVGLGVRGAWVMCEFKRDRGGWRSKVSCSFQILQDISKAGQQPYAFRETREHYSRGPLLNWTRVQTQGGGAGRSLSLSFSLCAHGNHLHSRPLSDSLNQSIRSPWVDHHIRTLQRRLVNVLRCASQERLRRGICKQENRTPPQRLQLDRLLH